MIKSGNPSWLGMKLEGNLKQQKKPKQHKKKFLMRERIVKIKGKSQEGEKKRRNLWWEMR